jgi:hypothetical protein
MDGIDLVSLQDEIAAHIVGEFPQYKIVEDDVLDDEYILRVNNKVKPFVVLQFGGLGRDTRGASFAGVRHDEYYSYVDIAAVAPKPRIARQVLNMFMDNLIGHRISSGSQLTPTSRVDTFAVRDASGAPHLYLSIGSLEFRFNSSNPNPTTGS